MNKIHVKKDDTVIVISGKSSNGAKPVVGKVLEVSPKEGKVIVEGAMPIKKHVKPRKQGDVGGIISANGAIYACKVMLYCPKCEKGVRVRHQTDDSGKKIRVCAKCGAKI